MSVNHGGDVWQGGNPMEYLDFSANLNPHGPPEWVRAAMARGLENARFYPDLSGRAARRGMAAHLGLPEDCVRVTAGGIEAIALAARLPGTHVIAEPTFQEYGRLCGQYRCIRRDELHKYPFSKDDNVWLCNPNNPTGDAISRAKMQELLHCAEEAGARLIVDEAFIEYCPENSVADLVCEHPSLMILGSLTKILAIPGIRLGYMAGHANVMKTFSSALLPWHINSIAEAVAAALPGHRQDFDAMRRANDRERRVFEHELRMLGIRVYPSDANFLLCDFGRDMRPTVEALRRQKILVRPCGMFPGLGHNHVRLCVRTAGENARLIKALKEV